jgi:NADH dehydrogenase [ubiquinone] 1 alpha subcomplex assembly factor 7
VSALEALLHHRIAARGPLSFAAFMELALYHPDHGYYAGGGRRAGWDGDFITSPELDPAFGALWAGWLERLWTACGPPGRFTLVEIGPGEGGFAHAVLAAVRGRFARALRVVLVEPSPALARRQRRHLGDRAVQWAASLEDVAPIAAGCVFANEVLDNQPTHVLARRAGRLEELYVTTSGDRLGYLWGPPSSARIERALEHAGGGPRDGELVEVSLAAQDLVAAAATRVLRGAAVFVDYGRAGAMGPSLVAYSGAGADEELLLRPGERDITAHVDWGAVRRALEGGGMEVAGPVRQAEWLTRLGAGALAADLRRAHAASLDAGQGAEAVRLLSRGQALAALLDRGGLGRLEVLVGLAGVSSADALPA